MMSVSSRSMIRSTIATVLVFGIFTVPSPTAVWPLNRASCRKSESPSSISAMSLSRIGAPSRKPTIIFSRSSMLWNSRSSLTRCSVAPPTMNPPATCRCSRVKASWMSCAAMPNAAMRAGSRFTRIVRSRRPPTRTSPTPSIVSSFFLMTLIAYWFSCCWVRSPEIAIQKIGEVLVSTFATTGGSASFGRRRSTWFTFACTSLNATSMRLSRLKVMLICDTPGEDVDWMCSMPGTLFTEPSMTPVIAESTTSGFAPLSVVCTETTGNST